MAIQDFDPPERFVAGTVGSPGQRTFFLQARSGSLLTSVSLEKVQVSLLADRMEELLAEAEAVDEDPLTTDVGPLDAPIEDAFRVQTLGLAWDAERRRLLVECHDRDPQDALAGTPETVRVHLTPAAAHQFIRRSRALVAAGRPPCPLCGQPLDPSGHLCPRANGYRR